MKSRTLKSFILPVCTFLFLIMITIWGNFFLGAGDEMGYSLICFYILMPIISVIFCFLTAFKKSKSLLPFIFLMCAGAFLIPFYVFGSFDAISFLFAPIPCAIGCAAGMIGKKLKKKRSTV